MYLCNHGNEMVPTIYRISLIIIFNTEVFKLFQPTAPSSLHKIFAAPKLLITKKKIIHK